VASQSKTRNIFSRLNTGIVGSNPTRGMDVYVSSVLVLSCVGSAPAKAWSPVHGALPTVDKIHILGLMLNGNRLESFHSRAHLPERVFCWAQVKQLLVVAYIGLDLFGV
jgi:hypothetical protein